jgi:hypothetical protein
LELQQGERDVGGDDDYDVEAFKIQAAVAMDSLCDPPRSLLKVRFICFMETLQC